jgi:hypothetical protein
VVAQSILSFESTRTTGLTPPASYHMWRRPQSFENHGDGRLSCTTLWGGAWNVASIEQLQLDQCKLTKMVECVTLWGDFVGVARFRQLADHFCQVGYARLMLGQAVDRSSTQDSRSKLLHIYIYLKSRFDRSNSSCCNMQRLSLVHSPRHSVDTATTAVQVDDRSFAWLYFRLPVHNISDTLDTQNFNIARSIRSFQLNRSTLSIFSQLYTSYLLINERYIGTFTDYRWR